MYNHIDTVISSAVKHHIFLLAAGITYNVIMFFLPCILVAVFFAGVFTTPEQIYDPLESAVERILPDADATKQIRSVLENELHVAFDKSSSIGWIGIPFLLWLSTTLFSSLRTGLNGIFEIHQPGFFLKYIFKDILLQAIFTVLLILSGVSGALVTVVDWVFSNAQWVPPQFVTFMHDTTGAALAATITVVFFLFLYYFIPAQRLPRFVLFWCTLISTVLWEASRVAFSLWAPTMISTYGGIYGAYGLFAITIVWLYYSSFILLFSAEIAKHMHEVRERKRKITSNV